MRAKDEADETAEKLFNMVRDEKPDQEVTDAIAEALRTAGPIWTFGVPAEEGLYLVWDGDDVFAAHWLNATKGPT